MKKIEKKLLDAIDEIIIENMNNANFKLIDITAELDISRTKLYRNILKLTGDPPNQYIRKKRLVKAKKILDNRIYSTVRETAYAVGFKHPSYFSRVFYEEFQILPNDLLKEE